MFIIVLADNPEIERDCCIALGDALPKFRVFIRNAGPVRGGGADDMITNDLSFMFIDSSTEYTVVAINTAYTNDHTIHVECIFDGVWAVLVKLGYDAKLHLQAMVARRSGRNIESFSRLGRDAGYCPAWLRTFMSTSTREFLAHAIAELGQDSGRLRVLHIVPLEDEPYGDDILVDELVPAMLAGCDGSVQWELKHTTPSPRLVRELCGVIRRCDANYVQLWPWALTATEREAVHRALCFGTSAIIIADFGMGNRDVQWMRRTWSFLTGSLNRNSHTPLHAFLNADGPRDLTRCVFNFLKAVYAKGQCRPS